MADHQNGILCLELTDGSLPIPHEFLLFRLFGLVIVTITVKVCAPIRHGSVRCMILRIGANRPDLIAIRKIQIYLGSTYDFHTLIWKRAQPCYGLSNALWGIIIIIVPAYYNLTLGQLIQAISLGPYRQLRISRHCYITDIGKSRHLRIKEITDLICSIIQNNPLDAIHGIGLRLETSNRCRNKLPSIKGEC